MELTDRQQKFWAWVREQHSKHFRKYTGVPYEDHLWEVAEYVDTYIKNELVTTAALAHDVVEDCDVSLRNVEHILKMSGFTTLEAETISGMVHECTDQYTSEAYPNERRADRKEKEAYRLGSISDWSQSIKYADFMSNIPSIADHDPDFAKVYIREKIRILWGMRKGDINLLIGACGAIHDAQRTLIQNSL